MNKIVRHLTAVAFVAAIACPFTALTVPAASASPGASASPDTRVSCAKVNEEGDCVPGGPSEGGEGCVDVDATGACVDQQVIQGREEAGGTGGIH